ncbi:MULTISPECIES: histidine phosphatase family protein [unclassified Streptomyces]|uniref:histidine phosphatase family protein n=1 Tax=unclassified Streptomyces TaxID=2593676 RepID=UPI0022576720|nr:MULTISPECIES: histidine phosphatase family protein [unclassified Streptomyces]MCX4885589.1 histidine phosphatase family protein [Streptomyces sp. NBC_00847]MCX5425451.1 histidine phosphatase family protein [Streptomyces sp. NBC_00078]
MTSRVTFVSPAMNRSVREARFDDGSPLDAGGAARARSAAGTMSAADRVLVSPTVRCRETASALGLAAVAVPELGGMDVGRWRGRTLGEVSAEEPDQVAHWLADPAAAPHGGESVQALCERVGRWLEATAQTDGRTLVVVEPEIVRAAVVRVLAVHEATFWRLDVPPLTATEISGRSGRWNLRLGQMLGARESEGGH